MKCRNLNEYVSYENMLCLKKKCINAIVSCCKQVKMYKFKLKHSFEKLSNDI